MHRISDHSWIFAITVTIAGLWLAGCQHVELKYATPSTAGNFEGVSSQANEGYQYFALNRSQVLFRKAVVPADGKADKKEGTPSAATGGSDAGKASKTETTSPAGPSSVPSAGGELAKARINGEDWEAVVIPMPDDESGILVRGVSGYWKTTTIGVTRYSNSELPSSIASTAENLVPKRIGQIAGIAATLIKGVGGVPTSSTTPGNQAPLQPFTFAVGKVRNGQFDGWTWKFEFDDGLPPGTVSRGEFLAGVGSKTVNYWPVPACRSGRLILVSNAVPDIHYTFGLTVASPEALRLQPLPVSGKLDLGTVCSGSTTGTASGDATQEVSDDLEALQKAVTTIKDAKKKPATDTTNK